ncbi:hypothetical protein [Clostridium perfringens]|uniref:hypothetical protein n=1 Tax=Clostridium perfringens TaxID=1502 RepID=UPI00016BD942|nr:hypothetical protein [Clostridium perfringens]EDT26066.1 hypothetical protein AC5_1438 [Clostridium perfringens CPE str. F4969]
MVLVLGIISSIIGTASLYENNGIISEYNKKLLDNLLGTNWNKEYLFGDKYMSLEGEI